MYHKCAESREKHICGTPRRSFTTASFYPPWGWLATCSPASVQISSLPGQLATRSNTRKPVREGWGMMDKLLIRVAGDNRVVNAEVLLKHLSQSLRGIDMSAGEHLVEIDSEGGI